MSTCPYTSINNVLVKADAGALNITLLVQSLPEYLRSGMGERQSGSVRHKSRYLRVSVYNAKICSGIFDPGELAPQLPLANVSYTIRSALLFVFGPLFCLFWCFKEKWPRPQSHRCISAPHDSFLGAHATLTIPAAIAAIVRLKQSTPLFEITPLQALLTMQSLLTMQFIG